MLLPQPCVLVIFGAAGDLSWRKLLPAVYNLNVDGVLPSNFAVVGFGIEGHGDHDTIMRASRAAKEYVQWASELQRVECPISDLWVSTKCGESDTTSGCGANPTVGNAFDKLHPLGNYLCFGETSEITGGEKIVAGNQRI